MPQENVTPYLSVVASSAIAPGLRVKWHTTAGQVAIAGDEACIGTAKTRAYAAGDPIVIVDIRAPGTRIFVAGDAIAVGAGFTSAAAGVVADGSGGTEDYGVAITASAGAGELIEATPGAH